MTIRCGPTARSTTARLRKCAKLSISIDRCARVVSEEKEVAGLSKYVDHIVRAGQRPDADEVKFLEPAHGQAAWWCQAIVRTTLAHRRDAIPRSMAGRAIHEPI